MRAPSRIALYPVLFLLAFRRQRQNAPCAVSQAARVRWRRRPGCWVIASGYRLGHHVKANKKTNTCLAPPCRRRISARLRPWSDSVDSAGPSRTAVAKAPAFPCAELDRMAGLSLWRGSSARRDPQSDRAMLVWVRGPGAARARSRDLGRRDCSVAKCRHLRDLGRRVPPGSMEVPPARGGARTSMREER